jgi:hypothetical protein
MPEEDHFPSHDLGIVRDLAKKVRELALSDRYEARRRRWRDANERRRGDRAPVWCRPAGMWREVLPPSALECSDRACRQVEYAFRQHLYKDSIGDDHIVEPYWSVGAVFKCSTPYTWGLPTHKLIASTDKGGFRYHHPVETPEDYEKITVPDFSLDRAATERTAARMQEMLGDAMPVRLTGSPPLGPQLGTFLEQLRGMAPLMEDLAFRPALVHRAMAKLTEGALRAMRAAEQAGALTTNYNEPMTCSDPINDPPASGPVRLHHLWSGANSQEFDQVSPAMFEEFLLNYQMVLFQQYGGVWYGCCENLTTKIGRVLRIPNLRVFVCSFWTDLDKVVEACGHDYTIMWRQSSAQVTVSDTLDEHRRHLEAGLRRLRGCHYQIVLRELETLNGRPERLRDWARLAIEMAENYAG